MSKFNFPLGGGGSPLSFGASSKPAAKPPPLPAVDQGAVMLYRQLCRTLHPMIRRASEKTLHPVL